LIKPLGLLLKALFQESGDGAGRPFPTVVSNRAPNLGFVLPRVEPIWGKIQLAVRVPPVVPNDSVILALDRHVDGAATTLRAFGYGESNLSGLVRRHQRAGRGRKEASGVFCWALFESGSQDVLIVDDRSDLD
jgi:hypothetical protein